jgi:hypothetical protein
MGRDGPSSSCGKKVLNHQMFIISYLQFMKRKHLRAALCSSGCGTLTVAGTAQAAAHTPKGWFSEVIQKLKGMAAICNLGGKYVELAVV